MNSPIIELWEGTDTYRYSIKIGDDTYEVDFIDVVKAAPPGDVYDWYSGLQYVSQFWQKFI